MDPDPVAEMRVDAPKAANRSRYDQVIRLSREMPAGLKILCAFKISTVTSPLKPLQRVPRSAQLQRAR